MKVGEMVLVLVNGGQYVEAEVIEIHGDIVRVAGPSELLAVRRVGRPPLGVGFPIRTSRETVKAKFLDNA